MAARQPTFARTALWRLECAGFDLLSLALRALPIDAASGFGGWLFGWLGPLTPTDRIVRRNLQIAFPEKTEAERDAIRRAQWRNLGRTFAEFPLVDRIARSPGRIELVGAERFAALREAGRPAVFVSAHLSNFELMMATIVAQGLDCAVAYRPTNNPYVDARILSNRARYGVTRFAAKGAGAARDLLAALRSGVSVAMLVDQKTNEGPALPLFGLPATTALGAPRLALRDGAAMQPLSVQRLKGARFRVTAHAPLTVPRTQDRNADVLAAAQALNGFIEARVRAAPSDWFWVHRRWPKAEYRKDQAAP